jgi:DNA-binding SARP family transcriptional activator/tetratricopeptide (TPR) repeat protein
MPEDSKASPRFHITLFGGPLLRREGVLCASSPLQAGFLGLLYGHESSHLLREEILTVFWPEEDPPTARRRLNQLLYSIKKRFGEPAPFSVSGEEVHRVPDRVGSDLSEFSTALAAGTLNEAATILSGRFLKNCEEAFTREFSDWIRGRDQALRTEFRTRARDCLAKCEAQADWPGAHRTADSLFALDPLNEEALRLLLRTRARAGNFLDVESTVQEFSSRTQEVLGLPWKPSEETLDLIKRIRSQGPDPRPTQGLHTISDLPEPPLFGRGREHKLLRRTLASPPHEALRGILVTGEAGIGKTRLITESISGLGIEGQSVFRSGSAELERIIPLNPLIEALAKPLVQETLSRLDDPWRAVLYGVMPRHYTGPGPIPQAPQIQPGSVPRRLFEAFHQLFLLMIEAGPVVLVFEDIHWADETTLAVLDFLVRRWDEGRLQLLVSVRSEELNRSPALKSFLDTIRTHNDSFEVPLSDLTSTDARALIHELSDRPLEEEEVLHLQALAGGNPFFLIELTLEYLAGRVDQPSTSPSIISIPLSIRQVLRRRLEHLSSGADRLLGALSVYVRPLSFQELADLVGIPIQECVTALDQLHQFRLIRGSGNTVSNGHELIRQTVYQGLSEPMRAWLHEQVARHLEGLGDPVPVDELAIHFHAAGLGEEARNHSRTAADHAEASGAVPEALRFLGIAREHAQDPDEVAELIARMGHLHYLHQNLEEAAPLLEIAAQRLRRQGHHAKALSSELERVDALGQSGLLPFRECLEELGRLKREAKELGEWGTYMRVLDIEVHFFHHSGDLDGVIGILREAGRVADLGNAEARCRARAILALNLYFGDPTAGVTAAREAVKIALGTPDRDLQLHALNRLIVVLLYQGRLHSPEGEKAQSRAADRLSSSGDLILKFFVRLNKAVWHLEAGELGSAKSAFEVADSVLRGTRAKDARLWLHLNRGELDFALDDIPAARRNYSAARALLGRTSPKVFRTVMTAGLGLCAIHEGDLAEAKQLERDLPDLPSNWTYDPSVIALFKAEMLRMRGDTIGAQLFLRAVTENIKDRFVTAWLKLSTRRTDFLLRISRGEALSTAQDTLAVAEALKLRVRSEEIKRRVQLIENG